MNVPRTFSSTIAVTNSENLSPNKWSSGTLFRAGENIDLMDLCKTHVLITEMFGKTIYENFHSKSHFLIDITDRAAGPYMIKLLTDGGQQFTKTIIIQP
jgi:hypothetical protein